MPWTTARYAAATAAAVTAAVLTAGCTTSTAGTGHGSGARSATASPDFPTTAAGSTATSAVPSAAATSSAGPSTHPVPSTPLSTGTVTDTDGTTYGVEVWAEVKSPTCADHAYGKPMIEFLTKHPCGGLTRRLATTAVGGRAVGMAISDLGFAGTDPQLYRTAGEFLTLVTKNGTGNLDDLLRDGYRLPAGPTSVPSPDAFSAVGQDGGVEVVDAWYLSGATPENDPALVKMEQSLFLQLH